MYENLLKTVTNLGKPKVLVVGDLMLDIYVYGDAERISPEAPVPVLKINRHRMPLRRSGSRRRGYRRTGAVPICLGVIGQDNNGKTLSKLLTQIGADTSGLFVTSDRPTISKQRLIGLAQHRHQQQLFRMDEESDRTVILKNSTKKFCRIIQKQLKHARYRLPAGLQ